MYAVIQSGGKQYRVQPGDIVQIEKLEGDVGSAVKFDQVLFASEPKGEQAQIWLGKPTLSGALVAGEIVGQGRGEKILIIKMKRRKQYRRTQGHRQYYTQVLITDVANGAGGKATLTDADRKTRMGKFQSHLAPKGEAFTPKLLGTRGRRLEATRGGAKASQAAESATTEKKAPAKKAAPAKKKTAAKKK